MSEELEHWVEQLNGSGLPVFAKTVREVASVTSDRASSARDLSEVVSHDAAMTARIIQIANSSLFNPQNRKVDTISAAVVLMGFDAVRDLAISLSLIDEMNKTGSNLRVAKVMARAFHAAVQANSLANEVNAGAKEEVFVATLLKDIGEMAFWSKGGAVTDDLHKALATEPDEDAAQQSELGFTLSALGARLAEKWNLGKLAVASHDLRRHKDPTVGCIVHGHELAVVYEKHGWASNESRELIAQIAGKVGVSESSLRDEVEQNIEEAIAIAKTFGIVIDESLPADVTPSVVKEAVVKESTVENTAVAETMVVNKTVERTTNEETRVDASIGPETRTTPDIKFAEEQGSLERQMDSLDQLAVGLEEGLTRDELMQMLVDGLCSGLGAQSSYFMLLSPERDRLIMKYAAGERTPGIRVGLSDSPVLVQALGVKKPQVVATSSHPELHESGEAIVSGVQIGGRDVGILYVERTTPFAEKAVGVFRQFSQQVVLILTQAG